MRCIIGIIVEHMQKLPIFLQMILDPERDKFTIDDHLQGPVDLVSSHRNVIAATFHKFLGQNIGGSEKFQDKQGFFYNKLREQYSRQSRDGITLHVQRSNLLESVS